MLVAAFECVVHLLSGPCQIPIFFNDHIVLQISLFESLLSIAAADPTRSRHNRPQTLARTHLPSSAAMQLIAPR